MTVATHEFAVGMQTALGAFKPAKPDVRKARVLNQAAADRDFFFRTFLPHMFDAEPAPWHLEVDRDLGGARRLNRRAPRDHAKSMRVVIGDILYNLYHRRTVFSVVLRATLDEAYEVIDTLLAELETNEKLREFYGDLYHPRKWGRKGFVTRWGQMVVAKSRGGKIRGIKYRQHRPDHLYLDDLDDDDSVATAEQRQKAWRWFTKAVVPSVAKGGVMISVGTVLHDECLVSRLDANPVWDSKTYQAIVRWPDRMDLWERWEAIAREQNIEAARAFYEANEAEMLAGARVLWPQRYTLYDLMLKRLEIGPTAFAQEYQNEARDEDAAIVRAEWLIDYHLADVWGVLPLQIVTACDPATGRKTEKACDTAIVTIGAAGRHIYVLETLNGHWSGTETELRLYETWQRWHARAVVIETIGFQVWLADACQTKAVERGRPMPIVAIDHQTVDKVARVQHLATYVQNGILRFLPEQTVLKHQLVAFRNRHDPIDLGDALELAVRQVSFGAGPLEFTSTGINRLAGMERY